MSFWKAGMTGNTTILDEIREVNISYMLLAQQMIRADKPTAMVRMGISEQIADTLESLTLAQTVKLATTNQMLCQFRFDDHVILSALAEKSRLASTHAAIVLAAQPLAEAA